MKETLSHILEITFTLVLVYLLLSNSFGLSQVLKSAGAVYTEGVKALQGRG